MFVSAMQARVLLLALAVVEMVGKWVHWVESNTASRT